MIEQTSQTLVETINAESYELVARSAAVKYTTTNPKRNTPLSTRVDHTCKPSNCMRAGLSAGTDSISPMDARSVSMRGMMPNCEIRVSTSIKQMSRLRAANTCGEPLVNWL